MKGMPGMLWGLSLHSAGSWLDFIKETSPLVLGNHSPDWGPTKNMWAKWVSHDQLMMGSCNREGQGHSISILSHPGGNSYAGECLISIKSSCWSRLRLFTARAVNAPPTKSTSGVLYLGIDGKLCKVTAWKHSDFFPTVSSMLSLWEWKNGSKR